MTVFSTCEQIFESEHSLSLNMSGKNLSITISENSNIDSKGKLQSVMVAGFDEVFFAFKPENCIQRKNVSPHGYFKESVHLKSERFALRTSCDGILAGKCGEENILLCCELKSTNATKYQSQLVNGALLGTLVLQLCFELGLLPEKHQVFKVVYCLFHLDRNLKRGIDKRIEGKLQPTRLYEGKNGLSSSAFFSVNCSGKSTSNPYKFNLLSVNIDSANSYKVHCR
jgi:hypothetical protein